jgi:signal transduction histidine kinase
MNLISAFHAVALAINIGLGIGVYRTNPRRATNQLFLLLSGVLALWLGSLAAAFALRDIVTVTWCIRVCHSVAAVFPLVFDYLRLAIIHPDEDRWSIIRRNPVWLGVTLGMAVFSMTPWIVDSAYLPQTGGGSRTRSIPEPMFGYAFTLYGGFYVASLILLIWRFYRSVRAYVGMRRAELQFILLGSCIGLVVAFWFVILMPMITGSSQSAQLGPTSVIVLDSVVAYGIATRRIMDVAYVFRLMTAYALLTAYLVILYLAVWQGLRLAFLLAHTEVDALAHLAAAIAVAFALAPAHGRMQRFANKMFVRVAPLDVGAVAKHTSQLLQSISTVGNLLKDFAAIVARTVDTDRILIFLAANDGFERRYPDHDEQPGARVGADEALPRVLARSDVAVVPDVVRRLNPDAETLDACRRLDAMGVSAAVGLHAKAGLEGFLLLGPRLSGRIYGTPEQQMLQLLSDQLSVALNNASLYTQAQDAKIYNDMLVDNLASGVIAADKTGLVTVFNREAQRITRQDPAHVLRHPADTLPQTLADLLRKTLDQGYGLRDQELALQWPSGDDTPIRVSSSVFYGHTGGILGAFLVVNDLTMVKQLEHQVRRTDRLASLGTLAAGMAHEIKNPLVSLKTFTQLLPERYEDADFRDTFFSLVGGEIKRIDGIVNQLLRFSRPAKPNLQSTALHAILENALKLMSQQMRQKNIRLVRQFDAPNDTTCADADQINQAFVNLFLNAIEAMKAGGTLTVQTTNNGGPGFPTGIWDNRQVPLITVTVRDTGEGIPAEAIPHIFDPFFTTKSHGTGLGLSVAHGIVQEHHGLIDVRSEPGAGTTFAITLPLVTEAPA